MNYFEMLLYWSSKISRPLFHYCKGNSELDIVVGQSGWSANFQNLMVDVYGIFIEFGSSQNLPRNFQHHYLLSDEFG